MKKTTTTSSDTQKNSFVHLVNTVFTGRGIPGYGGDEWYEKRIETFKKYCVPSLRNQTNKDFIHWICFRPEEKDNKLTKELGKYLDSLNYKYIFTFHGQPFRDDKKSDLSLLKRLRGSIEDIKKYIEGKDYVLFSVLDSDDMYRDDYIEIVQKEPYKYKKAMIAVKGFALNTFTGQLADWNHPSCPPYYTIFFPVEVFLNAEKHLEYYYPFVSHEDTLKVFECENLPEYMYCCTMHSGNISTAWFNQCRGREYFYDNQKQIILKKFGQ